MKKLVATFLIYGLICLFSQQPNDNSTRLIWFSRVGLHSWPKLLDGLYQRLRGCSPATHHHSFESLSTLYARRFVDSNSTVWCRLSCCLCRPQIAMANSSGIFARITGEHIQIYYYLFIFLLYVLCNGYICRWWCSKNKIKSLLLNKRDKFNFFILLEGRQVRFTIAFVNRMDFAHIHPNLDLLQ